MRTLLVVFAVFCLVTQAFAAPAASKVQSKDGALRLEARTISGSENKFIASGNARLYTKDEANKTTLEVDASKIDLTVGQQNAKNKSGMIIQSAELTGPVKMNYCVIDDNGVPTKTIATADSATFDGASQVINLSGNVKITYDNPTIFAEPAVMAGDKAVIHTAPNLDKNQIRFSVESTNGLSTITAVPKEKESQ